MIEEHERLADDTRQQADRPVDTLAAALEIAETAALQDLELRVVCREEGVEGLCEDVDDGGQVLALPVESTHLLEDELGVREVGCDFRGEQFGQKNDVVQSDRHAAAGERVAHIHGVAEEDQAGGFIDGGREERVGHGAKCAFIDRGGEGGLHARRQRGEDDGS